MLELRNQTMSSREIAELTGKMHKHILVDCDKLNESYNKMGMDEISSMNYKAENGQAYREYLLAKTQTFDLMTGYNTELRIKVNRRWQELEKKVSLPDFTNPAIAARAWADEVEKRIEVEEKTKLQEMQITNQNLTIRQMQPKVEFADTITALPDLIDMSQAAKLLNMHFGRNTLCKKLRERGIFFKSRNEPLQRYSTSGGAGYFTVKEKVRQQSGKDIVYVQTYVTQKGLLWLFKVFNATPIHAIQAKIGM